MKKYFNIKNIEMFLCILASMVSGIILYELAWDVTTLFKVCSLYTDLPNSKKITGTIQFLENSISVAEVSLKSKNISDAFNILGKDGMLFTMSIILVVLAMISILAVNKKEDVKTGKMICSRGYLTTASIAACILILILSSFILQDVIKSFTINNFNNNLTISMEDYLTGMSGKETAFTVKETGEQLKLQYIKSNLLPKKYSKVPETILITDDYKLSLFMLDEESNAYYQVVTE